MPKKKTKEENIERFASHLVRNCRDCIYYSVNLRCCNYSEIMDELRPCPPGDRCTVKEKKGRRKS